MKKRAPRLQGFNLCSLYLCLSLDCSIQTYTYAVLSPTFPCTIVYLSTVQACNVTNCSLDHCLYLYCTINLYCRQLFPVPLYISLLYYKPVLSPAVPCTTVPLSRPSGDPCVMHLSPPPQPSFSSTRYNFMDMINICQYYWVTSISLCIPFPNRLCSMFMIQKVVDTFYTQYSYTLTQTFIVAFKLFASQDIESIVHESKVSDIRTLRTYIVGIAFY